MTDKFNNRLSMAETYRRCAARKEAALPVGVASPGWDSAA